MSTLNGYPNPEGEVLMADGGMSGVNLYSNSAPVVALPMSDYMADDPAQTAPAPAPAAPAASSPPEFSFGAALMKPRFILPVAVGAVIGWCLSGEEDKTEKAKSAAGLAAGVGLAALVGDWLSSK